MRARRALLYMPGDDMHKIRKAATLEVDCICMDMEDSVAFKCKAQARATIAEALRELDTGRCERLARINPVGSGLEVDDLSSALPGKPDGIVIPKVEYAEQVRWVSQHIAQAEKQNGWDEGGIHLLVIIETARAVVNLPQIAGADPRLEALIFGAEDFAGDIGATRSRAAWEVFYARSAVVTHAAAAGLQAIDIVFLDLQDIDGLRQEAEQGAAMGFAGKQIIHPKQVVPVQEAFTPSQAAIAQAQRLLEAFEQHQAVGVGAFVLDGKMVDAPAIKSAERILALSAGIT
ncbi:MAG: CoA ester lyase [Anaerolineales bacterium]|nr:CoA ester lyase [Anaerolineales bacterium]